MLSPGNDSWFYTVMHSPPPWLFKVILGLWFVMVLRYEIMVGPSYRGFERRNGTFHDFLYFPVWIERCSLDTGSSDSLNNFDLSDHKPPHF